MAKKRSILPFIAGLALGGGLTAAAFLFFGLFKPTADVQAPVEGELHLGQTGFINPLIDCPQMPEGRSPKKNQIQEPLNDLIQQLKEAKIVDQVSVAYRDLNNGPTFSINVDEPFMAASLLKVPIAITLMKKSATYPGLFNERLSFNPTGPSPYRPNEALAPPLTPNQSYRVEELMRRMLVFSDNDAAQLLLQETPPSEVIGVLREMGISLLNKDRDWWITVGEYGSMFRILYNSTFLTQQGSSHILRLLSEAKPTVGLVTGVESGVTVSHKFGERGLGGIQQFHDCGIVYYPKRPYLLCIMTRGSDLKQQEKAVEAMSRLVFDQVKKQTQ